MAIAKSGFPIRKFIPAIALTVLDCGSRLSRDGPIGGTFVLRRLGHEVPVEARRRCVGHVFFVRNGDRFMRQMMRCLQSCEQGPFHRIFSRLPSVLIEISFAPGGIEVVMVLPPGQRTHTWVGG